MAIGCQEDIVPIIEDYDRLVQRMAVADPKAVSQQTLTETIQSMNNLAKSFSKETCAKDFSKTWKYAPVFNWFQDLMDLQQCSQAALSSKVAADKKEEEIEELNDEIKTGQECLEDLKVYGLDSIKEEIETLNNHIKACTEK